MTSPSPIPTPGAPMPHPSLLLTAEPIPGLRSLSEVRASLTHPRIQPLWDRLRQLECLFDEQHWPRGCDQSHPGHPLVRRPVSGRPR